MALMSLERENCKHHSCFVIYLINLMLFRVPQKERGGNPSACSVSGRHVEPSGPLALQPWQLGSFISYTHNLT